MLKTYSSTPVQRPFHFENRCKGPNYLEMSSRIIAISLYSNEIEIGRTLSLKEGTGYGLKQIKKPNHFEKLTFYDVQLCFYKHRRFFQ